MKNPKRMEGELGIGGWRLGILGEVLRAKDYKRITTDDHEPSILIENRPLESGPDAGSLTACF